MESAPLLTPLSSGPSLSESTADLLREQIISGAFLPGRRLVEAELSRQLQISRGPIREALALLRAEGLVREEARRGSFVAELEDDDIREIYELRGALEGRATRLIIERRDQAALRRLRDIVDGLQAAAGAEDREEFARLDGLFHSELCRLSGNSRLHRAFIQHAGLLLTLLRVEVTTQYETLDELATEHERLYEDIASLDVTRAQRGCDRHLTGAVHQVIAMRAQGA